MSNTRRAEPGGPLRQERWASSEEFERGLLGNLPACVWGRESALEPDDCIRGVKSSGFMVEACAFGVFVYVFCRTHIAICESLPR